MKCDFLRRMVLLLLFMFGLASGTVALARTADFSPAELDAMLAPVALYPDPLLNQVLMAATYPLEVVRAARWSRAHPGLNGQHAVEAASGEDWDPSVTALVAFPEVLELMDRNLDWTEDLGDAFLAQQDELMDRVQLLRQRAMAQGSLGSSEYLDVVEQNELIYLRPAQPERVYVPYYDPRVMYGNWWWQDHDPFRWQSWPSRSWIVDSGSGYRWSLGIVVGSGFFYTDWDWRERCVSYTGNRPFYYRDPLPTTRIWVHDQRHRHGARYREREVERWYRQRPDRPFRREDRYRTDDRHRDGDDAAPGAISIPRDGVTSNRMRAFTSTIPSARFSPAAHSAGSRFPDARPVPPRNARPNETPARVAQRYRGRAETVRGTANAVDSPRQRQSTNMRPESAPVSRRNGDAGPSRNTREYRNGPTFSSDSSAPRAHGSRASVTEGQRSRAVTESRFNGRTADSSGRSRTGADRAQGGRRPARDESRATSQGRSAQRDATRSRPDSAPRARAGRQSTGWR